jgi:hypothetical protein
MAKPTKYDRRLALKLASQNEEKDRLQTEQARLLAERTRLLFERSKLLALHREAGEPVSMTDDEFDNLLKLAVEAGPEAMEWFKETARMAGRGQ